MARRSGVTPRLVPRLLETDLVDGWITCGRRSERLEAVTLWTGLLAAKEVLDAEVMWWPTGPEPRHGHDVGRERARLGHALNAAHALGGRPVAALRASSADRRERHRGISHHSITILSTVCTVDVNVAIPSLDDDVERDLVWDALRAARLEERHQLVEADGRPALAELEGRGVEVTSMGRSPAEDPLFFLAAGAAGVMAGRMAAASRALRWRHDP
jgi:hypothetical protein